MPQLRQVRLESGCCRNAHGEDEMTITDHYCAQCGKLIVSRNAREYQFKIRDWRKESDTFGKTLWFCKDGCMRKFEKDNNRKRNNKWEKL